MGVYEELIPKLCKIRTKEGGLVPFNLYGWQREFLGVMGKKNIVLKSRQIGCSTLICAILYLKTVASEGVNTKIIANKKEIATVLLDTISIIHGSIPEEFRPECKHESRFEFFFEGINSRLSISASTKEAGRGETIHNLLCSEVAFWENPEETMLGLLECVPKDGLIFVESTPNGVGGWFYEQYVKAPEIGWVAHKYDWTSLPEYCVEGWKEQKVREKGELAFNQEYACDFIQSQRVVLTEAEEIEEREGKHIELYSKTDLKKIVDPVTGKFITREQAERVGIDVGELLLDFKIKNNSSSLFCIWEKVKEDHDYVIGADVSEGLKKGDYSCAYVIDVNDFKVVGCWHGHTAPDLFGNELIKVGRYFNNALIGIEANNHGLSTLNAIKEYYPNLYFREAFDEATKVKTRKLGWLTTIRTKPLMIDDLARVLRERELKIYDKKFKEEARTFVYLDNGRTEAISGCHDDRIIALAIAVQMYLANPYIEDDIEYTEYMGG